VFLRVVSLVEGKVEELKGSPGYGTCAAYERMNFIVYNIETLVS
jgi:hypothetical protein